jgi:hypothetical protein
MPKEQSQPPRSPTLEEIAEMSRRVLLKDGYHSTMLIVEGSKNGIVVQLQEVGSTYDERRLQMFLIGMRLAAEGEIGVLQQAFFISEAWMSSSTHQPPNVRPSEDPRRQEVLLVSQLKVNEQKLATLIYDMKRDKKGKLIGATPRTYERKDTIESRSPLLEAFVAGYLGLASPDHN